MLDHYSKVDIKGPVLVVGGAYSGKSDFAPVLLSSDQPAAVIGTTDPNADPSIAQRIQELKNRRPAHWKTFESISELTTLVTQLSSTYEQILIDSLSHYLVSALFSRAARYDHEQIEAQLHLEMEELGSCLAETTTTKMIVVSSEINGSIAPERAIARLARRLVSKTHTMIAQQCPTVIQMVAGIPRTIKP